MKQGTLFIVSAPSGTGKTTLVKALLQDKSIHDSLELVVTYTTRKPRQGDIQGKDYHFVTESEFLSLIKNDFFAEWSTAYGTYYGTPISALENVIQGKNRLLVLDRFGAQKIVALHPQAILIWITPPSLEVLKKRLTDRGTENEAQIERRLELARQEIEAENESPFYRHYIVNDVLENALINLQKIIKNAL